MRLHFSDINEQELRAKGYDKILILRDGKMYLGGKMENIMSYKEILKDKEVLKQFGDEDVWVVEIES